MSRVAVTSGWRIPHVVDEGVFTIYSEDNQAPLEIVSGAPLTARNMFVAALASYSTLTWESETPPVTFPITRSIHGVNVTFSSSGSIAINVTPSTAGRWNTTGATSAPVAGKWLAVDSLTMDFGSPITAFGFYGTDFGDFSAGEGSIIMTLRDTDSVEHAYPVDVVALGANGNLVFWGFTDTTGRQYNRIVLSELTPGSPDVLGMDDLIVGVPA